MKYIIMLVIFSSCTIIDKQHDYSKPIPTYNKAIYYNKVYCIYADGYGRRFIILKGSISGRPYRKYLPKARIASLRADSVTQYQNKLYKDTILIFHRAKYQGHIIDTVKLNQ